MSDSKRSLTTTNEKIFFLKQNLGNHLQGILLVQLTDVQFIQVIDMVAMNPDVEYSTSITPTRRGYSVKFDPITWYSPLWSCHPYSKCDLPTITSAFS